MGMSPLSTFLWGTTRCQGRILYGEMTKIVFCEMFINAIDKGDQHQQHLYGEKSAFSPPPPSRGRRSLCEHMSTNWSKSNT